MFLLMCKVFEYDLESDFAYCLGFMGIPNDLLFKPVIIGYIVIMMGAAMTVTPFS